MTIKPVSRLAQLVQPFASIRQPSLAQLKKFYNGEQCRRRTIWLLQQNHLCPNNARCGESGKHRSRKHGGSGSQPASSSMLSFSPGTSLPSNHNSFQGHLMIRSAPSVSLPSCWSSERPAIHCVVV